MLKMKLLLSTAEDQLTDQADQRLPRAVSPSAGVLHGSLHGSHRRVAPPLLDKETVFEWFGLHLDPARRLEFMCGLLHMCQPLELRFLGSYLEDLARRDYYVLRDFEFRANSTSELGILTDVSDPVVRSKLLVSLSLLGSDSRECAEILFQTLSRVEPAQYRTYDCSTGPCGPPVHCQDGAQGRVEGCSEQNCGPTPSGGAAVAPLEQLMLLFTMASLHPTFHFHQRQMLRGQLEKIQLILEEERRTTVQTLEVPAQGEDYVPLSAVALGECAAPHAPCPGRRCTRWGPQREAVHIERILLTGISQTKVDKEYNFKVKWSDCSSSSVTKSFSELENFLFKLPKDQYIESFVSSVLQLLKQGEQLESKNIEQYLREQFLSAPQVFRHSRKVWCFFISYCKSSCRCSGSRQACHGDSSDVSSEDEESFVKGHKKKHRNKSPSQSLSAATEVQVEHPSKSHAPEECESRSHMQPTDRSKGKTKASNGCFVAAFKPQPTNAVSGPESSTESSSCASSPQHRVPDSRDSEEDHHRDTESHSDESVNGLGPGLFFRNPPTSSSLQAQIKSVSPDSTDLSALSFMPPVPCVLPSGANETPRPPHPPLSQSMVAQTKSSPGTVMMHVPPTIPGPGLMIPPEKKDFFPTFGISSISLPPLGNSSVQPLVQRFKALPHGAAGSTSTPITALPAPLLPPMSTGLTAFCSNLQPSLPCQDASPGGTVPLVEPSHTKLPTLHLPYPSAPTPSSVMTPAPVQAPASPVVPTHTPSPAPSPSPALTHSMAHSDCTSYSHSTTGCGDTPMPPSKSTALQPSQHPALAPLQQPVSCGMCGCHCGGRTVSGSPVFLHQMATGARTLLTMPNLFPQTNYLPQAQANGTTLPPYYPQYSPLHSHGHTDMLGLQQHMGPSFGQRMYPQVYPSPMGVVPATTLGGGLNKKNGNVSCFNCGVSGHYPQDCTQPFIDSSQQGGFRLKYAAAHITEGLDNVEGAV